MDSRASFRPFTHYFGFMSDQTSSYLDHAATSPVLPEALEEMLPWLSSEYGNPSAVYGRGRKARYTLESCRARVAEMLGVGPAEIVFTSGGSESNNTVLAAGLATERGVITSSIEHEAVLEPVRRLAKHAIIQPDAQGRITVEALEAANASDFGMASFMLVNNELGTINPIGELAAWCHDRGMLIHTDAAQAARTVDLKAVAEQVDYLSLTAHKFGGPKGIGILLVKAGVPHRPLILGGGQEQDRRSGTENIAYVVGMTKALELAVAGREAFAGKAAELRSHLLDGLQRQMPGQFKVLSPDQGCTPHILNILVLKADGSGVDSEMLILGLDIEGVAVSAGSACSSGTMKGSHVLDALGVSPAAASGALRISFGPQTAIADIDHVLEALGKVMSRMGVQGK